MGRDFKSDRGNLDWNINKKRANKETSCFLCIKCYCQSKIVFYLKRVIQFASQP